MGTASQIPWTRVVVEGAVIVVSILLAFGIDAWWDRVQDRALEQEYLARLLDDQRANSDVIEVLNRQQKSQLINARRVYPLVSRGDWTGLDTALAVVSSYEASPTPTPTWVSETFEELKSTGNLGLLSPELRAALLEYYRFLERADYTYELMSTDYRDAIRRRMDPDLQLLIRSDCDLDELECRVEVASPGLAEYVAWLTNNPDLADGLRRVIVQWTRAETEYLPGVSERTEALSDVIRAEGAR